MYRLTATESQGDTGVGMRVGRGRGVGLGVRVGLGVGRGVGVAFGSGVGVYVGTDRGAETGALATGTGAASGPRTASTMATQPPITIPRARPRDTRMPKYLSN